jgi:hypothetical protein
MVNVGDDGKVTDIIHKFSAKVIPTTRAPKRPCNVLLRFDFTAIRGLIP